MPVERSAGIVIFRNTPKGRRYLVLHALKERLGGNDFWDFPKGILEKGEKGIDAAYREAEEEAGQKDFKIMPEFKETVHYFTRREGKPVPKYVAMFLAETKNAEVKLSWEHDRYEWLPYEEAYKKISLEPMKRVLKKAEELLNKKSKLRSQNSKLQLKS